MFLYEPEHIVKISNLHSCTLSVENILVLKFGKAILKNNKIDNTDNKSLIKRLFNFHAAFSNSDRRRYVVEEKLQQSKVKG